MTLKIPDFPCGNENTFGDVEKIPRSKVCDGAADCKNSADETYEVCSQIRCPPSYFQCQYGACIRKKFYCDGFNNCKDGSDEAYCGEKVGACNYWQYQCKPGECIEAVAVCNGRVDCNDGSDESDAVCARHLCPSYSFQCTYGGCISSEAVCNNVTDCRDESDELLTLCRKDCNIEAPVTQGSEKCAEGCEEYEFKCSSGTCIEQNKICDGVVDCAGDGIDEAPFICSTFPCPFHAFHCSYGGCIEANQACDGVFDCADGSDENLDLCKERRPAKSCVMPSFPVNGRHNFENRAYVPYLQAVHFSCNPGFELKGSNVTYCTDGSWDPPTVPVCEQKGLLCHPLKSRNLHLQCFLSSGAEHPCDQPAPEGTVAKYSCRRYFISIEEYPNDSSRCDNGTWSRKLLMCKIECGKPENVVMVPMLLHAIPIAYGKWPWQAALYVNKLQKDKKTIAMTFQCGGSLVSENIVITAAHCVWTIKTEDVVVALGKYYQEYDEREEMTQIIEVKEIIMHESYNDYNGYYESDIALLVLDSPVNLNYATLPVCLDRKNQHVNYDLSDQNKGKIVGWGLTENGTASNIPMEAYLPFRSHKSCVDELKKSSKYMRSSTFCAGYLNGTGVCNGDSGSGLMFQRSDGSWMIQGIVSVSPRGISGSCHLNSYAIFTRVGSYMDWLETNFAKIAKV